MKRVRKLTKEEIEKLEELYKFSSNTRVRERSKIILLFVTIHFLLFD